MFSQEGYQLCQRGPAWREHPDYYRDDPPVDEEEEQYMDFLESLPEAHQEEN